MSFDVHCRNMLYIQYDGHDPITAVRCRNFGYTNKNIGYATL